MCIQIVYVYFSIFKKNIYLLFICSLKSWSLLLSQSSLTNFFPYSSLSPLRGWVPAVYPLTLASQVSTGLCTSSLTEAKQGSPVTGAHSMEGQWLWDYLPLLLFRVISLNMIFSRFIHLPTKFVISFVFSGWIVYCCIGVPHFLHPFSTWGISSLFPVSAYY